MKQTEGCHIKVPENPLPEERKAASELRRYTQGVKSSKNKTITLARKDRYQSSPPEESYTVKCNSEGATLIGDGPPGLLFAAYDFLEHLGMRWWFEQPEGFRPPATSASWPKESWSATPAFNMRHVGNGPWSTVNRTNGQPDLGCGGNSPTQLLTPHIAHSFFYHLHPKDYFDEHPGWFPLIDGKRRKFSEEFLNLRSDAVEQSYSNQFCTSNEQAIDQFIENLRKRLKKNPTACYVPLGPNDGFAGFCECKACQAQDSGDTEWSRQYTARLLRFWNKVSRELAGEFPNVTFLALAYNNYARPPLEEPDLHCEPNLAIMLTHYRECMLHPVADPNCSPNTGFLNNLREWQERCKNVMIYEYYDKANWWGGLWPVWKNIVQDIPLFHELGIKGFYTQYCRENSLSRGLSYWLTARLTWDPATASQDLVGEWISGVYGGAADHMHQAYHRLAERFANSEQHIPGGAREVSWVFDEKLFAELADLTETAIKLAKTDSEKWAVATFARAVEHTNRLYQYSKGYHKAVDQDEQQLSGLKELFKEITTPLKQNPEAFRGVVNLERQFLDGKYLDGERKALQRKNIFDLDDPED